MSLADKISFFLFSEETRYYTLFTDALCFSVSKYLLAEERARHR